MVRNLVSAVVRDITDRGTPFVLMEGQAMAARTHKPLPTYISLEQAAEITEQSVKTIRRRISDGTIPAYRFGPRQIRIKLDDLEATARRVPSARW